MMVFGACLSLPCEVYFLSNFQVDFPQSVFSHLSLSDYCFSYSSEYLRVAQWFMTSSLTLTYLGKKPGFLKDRDHVSLIFLATVSGPVSDTQLGLNKYLLFGEYS